MSRRDLIRMTDDERAAFLQLPHNASLCVNGSDGYPHVTAMWYAVIDGDVHFATYAKSQKIVNLERDPKTTLLMEDGHSYDVLRGVMIQGDSEVIFNPELAGDVMVDISGRYMGLDLGAAGPEAEAIVRQRAAKRAVIRVHATNIVTWDHTKLGGTY